MRVTELGHVSLFVGDLEASVRFYRDILGLRDVGRGKNGKIAFFSTGHHHHDLSIELARAAGPDRPTGAPGLYHIAFEVGTTREALDEARRWVEAHGLSPYGETDSADSASLSIRDPDENQIELYVDLRAGGPSAEGGRALTEGVTRQIATIPTSSTSTTKPNAPR